ncbi:N-acetyldiaminopimelate deacetylase [Holzapfeliella sp. JNUCC 72]
MLPQTQRVAIRREFHQYPELALQEVETKQRIKKIIAGFKQDFLSFKHLKELPTALLVHVKGTRPKRTIGYRADMDALPVTEKTGLEFTSKNENKMHACGHDIHLTVALSILSYYADNQPEDNLVFFFQPAEESENGGKIAYELGAFEGKWRPDEFYGLHDNPDLEAGAIGCCQGTLFAGTTEVDIELKGKGGHAAFPHTANDMVVASAYLITQLQTIVSRNINPLESGVLTLGRIESGTIRNVIADKALIQGTVRGLTQTMIESINDRIRTICEFTAKSFDADVEVSLNQGGYLPVENDDELTAQFIEFMTQSEDVNFVETTPAMTGEDFGYLLSKIPGTMFWLGVDDSHPLHSEYFSPNEEALKTAPENIISFLNWRMSR